MENVYYTKDVKCPVCLFEFSTTKIRMNALKIDHKDEDFCIHYIEYNPVYYDIFVCPTCGYASSENSFDMLGSNEKDKLMKAFAGRRVERNFCGIRSYEDALDSYKIALYTAKLIGARKSNIAGLALKTAWMLRYANDENEEVFLRMALDSYLDSYERESSTENNMDELTMIYLMGEISRRLGMYEESINWFSRLASHPDKNSNLRIQKMGKEQWHKIRDKLKKI